MPFYKDFLYDLQMLVAIDGYWGVLNFAFILETLFSA